MDYNYLLKLKEHPTWRLLMADHAPFIVSFFYHTFIRPGAHSFAQSDLVGKLDDYLFHLRDIDTTHAYTRSAIEYLDDWAHNSNGYLRKYYPDNKDEPYYDLTATSEKSIEWLRGLEQKSFVGTESRLLVIFQMLREVVRATQMDAQAQIVDLKKEKALINAKLERLRQGKVETYDPVRVKERYFEIIDATRRLLSDFRQVEENFRQLDRHTREKIATSVKTKGDLLDEIFGEEDVISSSDQGRSFRAFWEFLMLKGRQEELENLVLRMLDIQEIKQLKSDDILPHLKYRLMEAGEKVRATNSSLVEHLRHFLDDQVWLENKRVMALIRSIEKTAVEIRKQAPVVTAFTFLEDIHVSIELPMARGLYRPVAQDPMGVSVILKGDGHFETEALYTIYYVDAEELKRRIRHVVRDTSQATLADVCARFPLEKGLSEIVVYLNLASQMPKTVMDNDSMETLRWQDAQGQWKIARLPQITFTQGDFYE